MNKEKQKKEKAKENSKSKEIIKAGAPNLVIDYKQLFRKEKTSKEADEGNKKPSDTINPDDEMIGENKEKLDKQPRECANQISNEIESSNGSYEDVGPGKPISLTKQHHDKDGCEIFTVYLPTTIDNADLFHIFNHYEDFKDIENKYESFDDEQYEKEVDRKVIAQNMGEFLEKSLFD